MDEELEPKLDAIVVTPVSNGYLVQVRLAPDILPINVATSIALTRDEINIRIQEILTQYPGPTR